MSRQKKTALHNNKKCLNCQTKLETKFSLAALCNFSICDKMLQKIKLLATRKNSKAFANANHTENINYPPRD